MSALPAFLAVLLLACTDAAESQTRLYLREGLPTEPERFPRINPDQWDLGSFSTTPPTTDEYRACGDVVLFAGSAGSALAPPADALDWDVWWTTGTGRASLALHRLGVGEPLAVIREAACEWAPDDPRRDGVLRRTWARTLLEDGLEGVDPASLYIAVEGTGADVRVRSCPESPSSLVVHHARPEAPLAAMPRARSGCAMPPRERQPEPLPAVPTPTRILPTRIEGDLTLEDEVVAVMGKVVVAGALRLEGATLLLEAGLGGETPHLHLEPGSSLTATGARLAAGDPALGFRLTTGARVTTTLVDTVFDHPGVVTWDERGRPRALGVVLDGPARIEGGAVRHGLAALSLRGAGSQVVGTHFVGNATALQIEGPDMLVKDVHSELDGLFLLADERSHRLRVEGVRVARPRAAAVRVNARQPEILLKDVEVTGAGTAGVALQRLELLSGIRFENVLLEACGTPLDPGFVDPSIPPPEPEGVVMRRVPELCPSRPD